MERISIGQDVINENDRKTIQIASNWITGYLNNLGGDFSTVELNDKQSTIANNTTCPCFDVSSESGDISRCTAIEKIINESIRIDDPKLTAGFICCSCNKDAVCTMLVNLDQWQE